MTKKKIPVETIPFILQFINMVAGWFKGSPEKRLQKALTKRIKARQKYLDEQFELASKGELAIMDIPANLDAWEEAYPRPTIDDFK